MRKTHVAFIVESAHGHINPILGMVSELVSRECRVTCAVKEYFAARVVQSGAEAVIYQPLDYRVRFIPKAEACLSDAAAVKRLWKEFEQDELEQALPQLEAIYRADPPDVIVYDLRNLAGRSLACQWSIPKVEHAPVFIRSNEVNQFGRPYDEMLVIASMPRAFQPDADALDGRFQFVGPIYGSRRFFKPWRPRAPSTPAVLVSASTADTHTEFFRTAIRAFENLAYRVILSIGDEIDPASLGPLPAHIELNQFSSHLDILPHVSLFVFQGGLGSTLEAFYCGVPALVVPPSSIHEEVAFRIAQMGLGIRLPPSATSQEIGDAAACLVRDESTRQRVKEMQRSMREVNGAKRAGDLILSMHRK